METVQETERQLSRQQFVQQVRRWGGVNTDAVLDHDQCQIFSTPSIEGFIGYRLESRRAIVFGEPVCAEENQAALAEAFQHYCQEKGYRVIYTLISEPFAKLALNRFGKVLVQFGNTLVFNPSENPLKKTGSKAVLIRKKVKHAQTDGVEIYEYVTPDPEVENAFEKIGKTWLQSRHGPQIYIAHLNFFADQEGKRWFYALVGEKVVGFLILNEIQAKSGWLLNNLILTAEAPSGTSELLIVAAFKALEEERCTRVEVGPVVESQIKEISGMNSFSAWMLRSIFQIAKRVFRLDGQTVFWEKFQPKLEPSYILFEDTGPCSLYGLFQALNVKL